MKIQEKVSNYKITEYSLLNQPNGEELKEWNKVICELVAKLINGRQFHFYINDYKNKSCLTSLSSFVTGNYNGIKYGIVSSIDISILSEIIDESEFYLGEIYLLIGEFSEDSLQNFIHYINFQNKISYASNMECVRMDNDGESIFWITPLKQENTMSFNRSTSNS